MRRTTKIFNPTAIPHLQRVIAGLLLTGTLSAPLVGATEITLAFPNEAKREVFFVEEEPQSLPVGGQEYTAREITLSVPKGKEEGYILVVEPSRGAVAFRSVAQALPLWKLTEKDWKIAEVRLRVESKGKPVEPAFVRLEVVPSSAGEAKPVVYERLAYRGEARFFAVSPGEATVTVRYLADGEASVLPSQRTSTPQRFLLNFSKEPPLLVIALPEGAKGVEDSVPQTGKAETHLPPPSRVGQWLLWMFVLTVGAGMVYLLYWWAKNQPNALLALRQRGVNVVDALLGRAQSSPTPAGNAQPTPSQPAPPPLVPEGHCPYCGEAFRPDGTCACTLQPATPAPAVPSSPQRFKLVGEQDSWSIPDGSSVVGREAGSASLLIPDPTVSRRHAEILNEGGRLTLKDLGSRNGTFVNGQPVVGEVEIRLGDTLQFGAVRVRVELEA